MNFDWQRIITPRTWCQVPHTSWNLDKFINELLDKNDKFYKKTDHTVVIGGHKIWIANYPYWSGCLDIDHTVVPSVKTRKRLFLFVSNPYNNGDLK